MAQLSAPLKTKYPKQEGRLAWVNLLGPDVTRLARVPHLDPWLLCFCSYDGLYVWMGSPLNDGFHVDDVVLMGSP